MPVPVPPPRPEHLTRALLDWFAAHARDLPWRHTRDPYAIWVSEVMLQQTLVQTVMPYWERWMRALPTLARLAAAPADEVLKLWEGLGYYHRARNLHRAATQILRDHGGNFPAQSDQILALPGIGPYTAAAIASLAWNQPAAVLDGNVIRVLSRLFGVRQRVDRAPGRRRLERLATALVEAAAAERTLPVVASKDDWRGQRVRERPCGSLNEALMELGAMICTPRQPRCEQCPVSVVCVARQAGLVARLPLTPQRPPTVARRVLVFVCKRNGRWLVRQRAANEVNAGLWEFPSVEARGQASATAAARAVLGRSVRGIRPLLSLRHAITRYRLTLEVHQVTATGALRVTAGGRWLKAGQFDTLAFSAAHRRIARHLVRTARVPSGPNQPGSV